jgi:hypothetical protein
VFFLNITFKSPVPAFLPYKLKDIEKFNDQMRLFCEAMETAPSGLLNGLEKEISFILNRIPFIIALTQAGSADLFPGKTTDVSDFKALLPAFISGVRQLTAYIRSENNNVPGQKLEKVYEQFHLVKKIEGQFYGA